MSTSYLGIDIGTSSVKAIVVDEDGDVRARSTASYVTSHPTQGQSQQNPHDWINGVQRCLAAMSADVRSDIQSIGIDGHVPSLVPVDASGTPTHASLIWQDSRATVEAQELGAQLGDAVPHIGTPLPWAPSQLPAKAAWLSRHAPDASAATRYLLQPKDFLNHALTGEFATDPWSSKGLCNVITRRPADAVLSAAGWTPDCLPTIMNPWQALGTVSDSAARRFGLPVGTIVATGWTDAMASVLASGAFDAPAGVILTGTSEIIGISDYSASPADGLYLVPQPVAPLALSYGPTQSGGSALVWISRILGLSVADALDAASRSSGTPPVFVPYLNGERAPLWNPNVRGHFVGLGSSHGPAELVRAVTDGVALAARHVLDTARVGGEHAITEVNVGGRGVDRPAWIDSRASAIGLPLRLHSEPHLTALGAAMLAALATGTPPADIARLRSDVTIHEPSPAQIERGERLYERYRTAVSFATEWSTQ
ncbi:xylulokinase [Paramicrobacterium chengjingii]|uniref:xylulokinase n=1 Tax=Paramicrobacterium chengjingii TaxID=2769067 RepID=UPI00141FA7DB|nr:FGGY family carbohydrate kinase [Microbacterium chengjingii]